MLNIKNLSKSFFVKNQEFKALNKVSLTIPKGKITAIVGESGSGKTTLSNIMLGVLAQDSGTMHLNDQVLGFQRDKATKKAIAWVSQNPSSSLNPFHNIFSCVALPLKVYGLIQSKAEQIQKVKTLLAMVDLDESFLFRYPSALSGGQKQRVVIARALACDPSLMILDEPTSALDVLVQTKILHLLVNLQRELQTTYVFITHDLAVVRCIADEVIVLYKGELMEQTPADDFFTRPKSDYGLSLMQHIPAASETELAYKEKLLKEAL